MRRHFYYQDPDYYNWVLITIGTNPDRKHFEGSDDLGKYLTKHNIIAQRFNPPPTSNPEFYIDERAMNWRREPARGFSVMREGIHAVLGLGLGLLVAFALFSTPLVLVYALTVTAIAVVLFIAYETLEGWRIRDWAYRDIGGFKMGFLPPAMIAGAVYILDNLFKIFG